MANCAEERSRSQSVEFWLEVVLELSWLHLCRMVKCFARCNVTWSTIYYFFAIVLLYLFLDNARPGNASAAAKSTKGGNEGRKYLGGPVIHVFKVTIS